MSQSKRAVVVIDMMNEFLFGQPDRRLIPTENIPGLVSNIKKLVKSAYHAEIPVVFVACAHDDDDPIFQTIPTHAIRGTWEARIIPDLAPQNGEAIIEKKTYDGFYQTQLENKLQELRINELILAGVQTDCCVHATGQGAAFRGFHVSLAVDCCDTINAERQRVGLERFRALIGPTPSLVDIFDMN